MEIYLHLYGGFPHSEISGSKVARTSPKLIAACHVFHRLLQPRHSPNALLTLDHSRNPYVVKNMPACASTSPASTYGRFLVRRFSCCWSDLWNAGVQRRSDGLFHNVNSTRRQSRPVETDEWNDCELPHPSKRWWSQTGSNRRPQACKASALPTELWPRSEKQQRW